MLPVFMADSVDASEIPEKFTRKPNGVAAYLDGDYAWPLAGLDHFPRHWLITVIGNPDRATQARVIDCETGDATPAGVAAYHKARTALSRRTVVYCDRSTVPEVVSADPDWSDLLWWIATLDDDDGWDPTAMASWLDFHLGVEIPASNIAAIQNYDFGHYDRSRVFIDPRWSTPTE